ncbi:MAG: amidohydrolase [Flavobacteriaceae bacterium]
MKSLSKSLLVAFALVFSTVQAQSVSEKTYDDIHVKVVEWRRHFHENPELGNREFKTAAYIEKHLRKLGLEVETGVGITGVIGILKGGKPGKVLALRADIDALPVTERNDLPFKSKVVTEFLGETTGVMHACGHDTHTAILMGVAEVLAKNKDQVAGTVKFIFQPAEEGPPPGEKGGALLMVEEGVLKNPDVDAIFGLHINSATPVGQVRYKTGGIMASAQRFVITVKGKQTHGSQPWSGVDPVYISSKIIDGIQSIISRESNLLKEAAVVSVGKIKSGVRFNIIPESAELIGTIRTLDYDMRDHIEKRMHEMIPAIAEAYGGTAEVSISESTDITFNDPELVAQMLPSMKKALGKENVLLTKATTGAEDFSYFSREVPGFYFFLGGMTPGNETPFPHHTPDFFIDENGLIHGVKVLTQMSLDYLNQ